jgi:hypothetical protein
MIATFGAMMNDFCGLCVDQEMERLDQDGARWERERSQINKRENSRLLYAQCFPGDVMMKHRVSTLAQGTLRGGKNCLSRNL